MREIEVKARLRDAPTFLAAAAQLGIAFDDGVTQDDMTYEVALPRTDPGWNIFRIRKQAGKQIFTMKYRASMRAHDSNEYETVVENADAIVPMLHRLGFSDGVRIKKHRRIAQYNGLELCLDVVDELGSFVEIEKLTSDDADVDAIQAKLWSLLIRLGVTPDDRVEHGYDVLMHSQRSVKAL